MTYTLETISYPFGTLQLTQTCKMENPIIKWKIRPTSNLFYAKGNEQGTPYNLVGK